MFTNNSANFNKSSRISGIISAIVVLFVLFAFLVSFAPSAYAVFVSVDIAEDLDGSTDDYASDDDTTSYGDVTVCASDSITSTACSKVGKGDAVFKIRMTGVDPATLTALSIRITASKTKNFTNNFVALAYDGVTASSSVTTTNEVLGPDITGDTDLGPYTLDLTGLIGNLADLEPGAGFEYAIRIGIKDATTLEWEVSEVEIEETVAAAGADPVLELGTHRWFQNLDATEPGLSATLNTPIIAPAQGTPVRLRLNLHVKEGDLGSSGTTTKLQFGEKIGAVCDPTGDETYADVTTSSAISYHDNTGVSDNAAISAHNFDPRHSSTTSGVNDTINLQNYNDGDTDTTFTNAQSAINQDEDGLWDFSLKDNSAPAGTTYCIRVVQTGGGVIGDYGTSTLPELRTRRVVRVHLIGKVRLRKVRLTGA